MSPTPTSSPNTPSCGSNISAAHRLPGRSSKKAGSPTLTILSRSWHSPRSGSPAQRKEDYAFVALDFTLLLQHAEGGAQRLHRVFEFSLAMGCRGDAAGAAAEVDPARHHREPKFVHDCGLTLVEEGLYRHCLRVETGRGDGTATGVGEDVE